MRLGQERKSQICLLLLFYGRMLRVSRAVRRPAGVPEVLHMCRGVKAFQACLEARAKLGIRLPRPRDYPTV